MDHAPLALASRQDTSAAIPAGAAAIIDAWSRYQEVSRAYLAQVAALVTAERAERPGVGEYSLVTDEREAAPAVEKIAQGAKDQLVHFAEGHFAPEGARLEIRLPDADELPEGDNKNLDLVGVWNYLAATYGGEGGSRKAFGDMAQKLSRGLHIRVGDEPKIVGGRSVFEVTVYADKRFEEVISYQDRERLNSILDGCLAVGEWAGAWGPAERAAVACARRDVDDACSRKVFPARRALGDSVLIVPFKSKWEFRVSAAFGTNMQLFLSEFDGFSR